MGIKASLPRKGARSVAQLKYIYINVHSIGNKQEELEAILQQESYRIVAIIEREWDDSHNWRAAMDVTCTLVCVLGTTGLSV